MAPLILAKKGNETQEDRAVRLKLSTVWTDTRDVKASESLTKKVGDWVPENFSWLTQSLAREEISLPDHVDMLEASSAPRALSSQLVWPFPSSVNIYWYLFLLQNNYS